MAFGTLNSESAGEDALGSSSLRDELFSFDDSLSDSCFFCLSRLVHKVPDHFDAANDEEKESKPRST